MVMPPAADAVDHYATLGIDERASETSVKAAYRKLARQWHPDKHPQDHDHVERRIREINAAYETLSNPSRRMMYDHKRQAVRQWLWRQEAKPAGNLSTPSYIVLSNVAVEECSERPRTTWLRPGAKVAAASEEESWQDGSTRIKVELRGGITGWARVKDPHGKYLAPWI
mmetsp:Transcript_31464/g.73504  ORF Transcript_31464/g.73504 Transcript_31464/m.73504 type:complete len:169 (+) Transcript_31464:85-591(+)